MADALGLINCGHGIHEGDSTTGICIHCGENLTPPAPATDKDNEHPRSSGNPA